MTLEKHKDAIIKWAKSCETSEQLNLLNEIVDKFIVKRFAKEDRLHVIMATEEINTVTRDQMAQIVVIETEAGSVPTLACYQNKQ